MSAKEADAAVAALGRAGDRLTGDLTAAVALRAATPVVLVSVELRDGGGAGVRIERTVDGFAVKALEARLSARRRVLSGEMDAESFYSSAVAQGFPDALISPFARVFAFDVDFQRDVRPGDLFSAVVDDRVDPLGRAVGEPTLVYAELQTRDRLLAFYAFESAWYDGAGRAVERGLMRTPVDGARVSSSFGMRRHPISGFEKLHKGVDFAAPTGTPVYAAADGTVEFSGPKGANGNFVRLVHADDVRTLYLHLHVIAHPVTAGARVRQGAQIGEVGSTGASTGPHLHYEVHVAGSAVDPATAPVGEGRSLDPKALARFRAVRNEIDRVRRAG